MDTGYCNIRKSLFAEKKLKKINSNTARILILMTQEMTKENV